MTAFFSNYNTLSWELNSRPPHSFADAVETIQRYCELYHTSSCINRLEEEYLLRNIVEAQAASIEKLVADQAELSQQMSKLMAAQSSKSRSNKCFKCGKESNFARNCLQQEQGNKNICQEWPLISSNKQRKGHLYSKASAPKPGKMSTLFTLRLGNRRWLCYWIVNALGLLCRPKH